MIYIGLTGWGDHPSLYSEATSSRDKLFDYSGHFPLVEVDTSFYAIPSPTTVARWCEETPDSFRFVFKAYQGMTGHLREDLPFPTRNDMFQAFRDSIQVLQQYGKLGMLLFQFPPWFDCTVKNIQYLKYVRQQLPNEPIAIEFRNQTWYINGMQQKTFQFLEEHAFIHTVCDEPQAGAGSVPLVPVATNSKALLRIHGRNVFGWRNVGQENWRKVRFLYDYNEAELQGLAEHVKVLQQQANDVYVLFNNNSGHHAAANAKRLAGILGVEYNNLSPKQMTIFEGEW